MMQSADRPATRLATRLAFLVAGFGVACWAPLVPFAKNRLLVDNALLGLLLLCLGTGSMVAMLFTGGLSARYGSRPIIIATGLGMALFLPLLTLARTPLELGSALFAFGAALGSLDVAMNIHAIEVERAAQRPLMSGFHGLYSAGGIGGATLLTSMLSMHLGTLVTTLTCSMLMALMILVAWPRLLRTRQRQAMQWMIIPRGVVWLLAALACITFLAEGAVLDWGALFIAGAGLVSMAHSGVGYILFSIAMTIGRLSGDAVARHIRDASILFYGSLVAIAGFVVLILAPWAPIALLGFMIIGLGASNIVPVLFRQGGGQQMMPIGLAVASITTAGYAGVLLGPAAIGLIAKHAGLPAGLWTVAGLLCIVAVAARSAVISRK
jgi:predicted MFS family arabinose efflux permease